MKTALTFIITVLLVSPAAAKCWRQGNRVVCSTPQVQSWPKVYRRDECIGPVIMGECKGSILPKGGYRPTCYGEWLNGQCTGPMF